MYLRGFKRNIFVDSLYLMPLLILKHELLIVGDYFLLFDNLLKVVYNASISTNLALKYYTKTRNAPGISVIIRNTRGV